MPVTIKKSVFKYKNQNGQYINVDMAAERPLAEQIAEIEAAGEDVLESIPSEYTELEDQVDDLETDLAAEVQRASGVEADLTTGLAGKINKPTNGNGTAGQILRTDGAGGTSWENPATSAEISAATETWLEDNITNPSNPPLDRSLSLENAAAPADMVGDLKSAIGKLDDTVNGENQFNSAVIGSNNNTALTNNNNGTYTVGTGDYGTTIFGSQVTLAPGEYYLYGVSAGKSFISTTQNTQGIIVQNVSSDPLKFTIDANTACYLGYRNEVRPSESFVIAPYVREAGMVHDIERIDALLNSDSDRIDNVENVLTIDQSIDFINGYYINTSYGGIGTVLDVTPVANSILAYAIVPCKKGRKAVVTGTGGATAKLWAFTDLDYRLISRSAEDAQGTNLELTAPEDGYLILNVLIASAHFATIETYFDSQEITNKVNALIAPENVTHITDPHLLFWRKGLFNANGEITPTSESRIWTSCRVKAGSRVVASRASGVQMQYGYKVDDSQTELDYYDTYKYRDVTVEQDCTIFIGILYTNPVYLPNDKIVELITIDLNVIDYVNKYRKDRVFGTPVPLHYVGQHTDTTGWNLDTANPDDIHNAFDALVASSDGWLTKKDLGVAYDSYHMYEYDTVPVGMHSYGGIDLPKVAIICCQHGNEKMSAYAMHYLMFDLIHNPSKNPVLSYLRSNCAISFIPIANPWGFINRSRLNENGVNLNRNWATYNWDEYSDDTSAPGGINYKGTGPASEAQTKLMVTFLRNNYDAVYAIDLHTNGENTIGWYEISTAIINADVDPTSENYKVQSSYYMPSKVITNYIKGWMDENYGTHLGNVFYGAVNFPEPDRPTAAQWSRESNNMVGITYEILAGNKDDYLGNTLKRYTPATIKAASEMLGDYLMAMLINCKEQRIK